MKKIMKRLLTGVLSLAAVFTTLPVSQVQAAEKQYWTDAQEKAKSNVSDFKQGVVKEQQTRQTERPEEPADHGKEP